MISIGAFGSVLVTDGSFFIVNAIIFNASQFDLYELLYHVGGNSVSSYSISILQATSGESTFHRVVMSITN